MKTTAPMPPRPPAVDRTVVHQSAVTPKLQVGRPSWHVRYISVLVLLDAAAMTAATFTAKISWLGLDPEPLYIRSTSIPYAALSFATVPAWIVLLALAGAYDLGPFGTAPRLWIRVVRAGTQLLAVIAVAYYIVHLAMLGRGVLVGLVPLAVVLTMGARWGAHVVLDLLRRSGRARRTALVVGNERGVEAMTGRIAAHPTTGVEIVGVALLSTSGSGPGGESLDGSEPHHLRIARSLARTGAETVIIAGGLPQGQLRTIAWMLEGTGIALLIAPAPADLPGGFTAGTMHPVAGLPLLHIGI